MKEKQRIVRLCKNGYYNFENVPQENNYIKIANLNCNNNKEAIKRAKRINPNYNYIIKKEGD